MTDEQRNRLMGLADLLASLECPVVDTSWIFRDDVREISAKDLVDRPYGFNMYPLAASVPECGTVCCALGWGCWLAKSEGYEGALTSHHLYGIDIFGSSASWMFNALWGGGPQDAARRIYWFLAGRFDAGLKWNDMVDLMATLPDLDTCRSLARGAHADLRQVN